MINQAEHSVQLISFYGGTTPVRSRWSYRAAEPFTIAATFETDSHHSVEWIFSRDLLVAGLQGPAGIGDVRLHPDDEFERHRVETRAEQKLLLEAVERAGLFI